MCLSCAGNAPLPLEGVAVYLLCRGGGNVPLQGDAVYLTCAGKEMVRAGTGDKERRELKDIEDRKRRGMKGREELL